MKSLTQKINESLLSELSSNHDESKETEVQNGGLVKIEKNKKDKE